MKIQGLVQRSVFAGGSHSEHEAMTLVSEKGRQLLRRVGGVAFGDPVLAALEGHTIVATGTIRNGVFLMSSWRDLGGVAADE